ncbi:MAG: CopG family transcriptional regulator [Syntrophales bacterium]|nr:CopG family transcriptional regulator [Syntrophales bacterium]
MIRTQIQIEDQQAEWLKATAKERGVSISQLIRDSINFYRIRGEQSSLKKRALAAVGRFASGSHDISERHDDYLTDAYETGNRHDNK